MARLRLCGVNVAEARTSRRRARRPHLKSFNRVNNFQYGALKFVDIDAAAARAAAFTSSSFTRVRQRVLRRRMLS
jgi:hypothetical protein